MKKSYLVLRVSTFLGGALLVGGAMAEEILPETIVTANRLETQVQDVGSVFSALEVEFLERRGIVSLEEALRFVPGGGLGSEGGQRGSISGLRLRGTEVDHTLFLVDGMRVTDANVTPFSFLGAESLFGLGRVHVLRGPQSALYGGEAIGGVVASETKYGSADGGHRLFVEGGSFDSLRAAAEFQGAQNGLSWFLGGNYEVTSNDRAANDFEQRQLALRLEQEVGEATLVGLTTRLWKSEFENPGPVGGGRAVDDRDASLVTIYLEHAPSPQFESRVTAGYYREEFEERGPFPFGSESEKLALDARNVVSWNDEHKTVVGTLAEWLSFQAGGVDEDSWQTGVYANHFWKPRQDLTFSVGGRWEHFDRWDDVLTWRATASWKAPVQGVRLHGSYGTAFRTPSLFELFGAIPAFGFVGNPNLREEESQGWDFGVEYQAGDNLTVDVTWFENQVDDLINFVPMNIGKAETRGLEVAANGSLLDDALSWRGVYTWVGANDETNNLRLTRRARHTASLDVQGKVSERFTLGAGASYLSGVADLDFATFSRVDLDEYLLVRVYGRYQLNEHITMHARVENLLDDSYEEILNFPGRGLGVFGGFEVEF